MHQLLSPPANFTGRDEELAELEKELVSAHTSGATISGKHAGLQGMGGVGKTALATMLAHKLKDRYPEAQLYLNLRGADPEHRAPVTPADAMQSIIHVFQPEAKLPEELDKLSPIYNSVLNEAGRVLLLFDNAADGEQVKPLLPPANCLLLVTSRTHFSLPGMVARDIDCLRPEKSQELLLTLAPRINGYEKDAAELCGHLPLALEVFAGVVESRRIYSVADLLELLRQQPAKLTRTDATFQVSHDLLPEDLRRRWTVLAVFTASFDLAAAAAVWEEKEDVAPETMQTLMNASLVEWNQANGRFRLHDLVCMFSVGKLTTEVLDAAHFAHARHYTNVGEEAGNLFETKGRMEDGLALFDRERLQIEAAYAWLSRREDEAAARQIFDLVSAVSYICSLRFDSRQRIAWHESQLRAVRRVNDRQNEGGALGNLGASHFSRGDAHKAIEYHNQHLVISREVGDRYGEAKALGNLGAAHADLGDLCKAIEFSEQALAISREIGDRRGEANMLGNLGNAHADLDDARKAIEFYEKALVISREIGDRHGEVQDLGNLGIAYKQLGDPRKAIQFYAQELVIARELSDRRGEGHALGNLGIAYAVLGDARKATEFYEQRIAIAREIGDRRAEGNALWNTALAHDSMNNPAKAIVQAAAALAIYEAIEDPTAARVRAQLAKWRGRE